MSGILEQAIEFLQNQSKSMQTMIGSGGDTGSSGGIGSILSQTPMGGGMDTAPTTQPSTMEIPTPSVTTTPPVTATLPVTTPPVNPSTPAPTPTPSVTAPTLGSSLGGLNPNPIPTGQEQNQFGSMTGNFNDPSNINAPTQGQSIFNNPVQGQGISNNPAMDQRYQQLMQQYQQARQTPTPMQMGGSQFDKFFAGLGAYQGADQAIPAQAIPAQAIPAQMSPNNFVRGPRPQVQLPSGATDQQKNMLMQQQQPMQNNFQTGLGQMGGMNQLFGRAFAGKPI